MSHHHGHQTENDPAERELIISSHQVHQQNLRFYVLFLRGADNSPATLNPTGLRQIQAEVKAARQALQNEPFDFLVIAGTDRAFCAGADLGVAQQVITESDGRALGELGHETFAQLENFPVPVIALLQGLALGGGLELALHCDYRISTKTQGPFGLPEVSLGIIPGWGGSFLLPHTVGIDHAFDLMVKKPASGRPGITAEQAFQIGLIDLILPDSAASQEDQLPFQAALTQLAQMIASESSPIQTQKKTFQFSPQPHWLEFLAQAQDTLAQGAPVSPSADRALDLLRISASANREASQQAEITHLAQSLISPEAKASLYSQELLRSARKQARSYAQQELGWQHIGIVGAGSMAVQIAVVISQSLRLPVYLRDINDEQVERARMRRDELITKGLNRGSFSAEQASFLREAITFGTDMSPLKTADLVIEAVSENLAIKTQVFTELDALVSPGTILASNTSALSISQLAQTISSPERVLGIHFFNPVERMPLVEIIQGDATSEDVMAQAHGFIAKLGKIGITVTDAPGFVVNRLLLRYLGICLAALERHTPAQVVIEVSRIIGLPMNPWELVDLVSPHIAADVLSSLRADLGPRFPHSPGLEIMAREHIPFYVSESTPPGMKKPPQRRLNEEAIKLFGADIPAPDTTDTLLETTQRALAEEVSLMLDEQVVADSSMIDLGMLLGAGWPTFRGGITPYLRQINKLQRHNTGPREG